MIASEFEEKLRRLNPRLYLGKNINKTFNDDLYSTGIYLRGFNDTGIVDASSLDDLTLEEHSNIRKLNETPDKFITWCTFKWIPEGSWFSEKGKVLSQGWREILLLLSRAKLIDLKKARKVFNCSSLGNSSYDHLDYSKKFKKYWKTKCQTPSLVTLD